MYENFDCIFNFCILLKRGIPLHSFLTSSANPYISLLPQTPTLEAVSTQLPPCSLHILLIVHGFSLRPEDWLTNDDCFDRARSSHTPGVDKAGSLGRGHTGGCFSGTWCFWSKAGSTVGEQGRKEAERKTTLSTLLFGVPFPLSLTQCWPEFTARPTGGQDCPENPRSRKGGGEWAEGTKTWKRWLQD